MADNRTPQEVLDDGLRDLFHGIAAIDESDAQCLLDLLTAAGYVLVQCPVGERRVVDRTPQPCPECNGDGGVFVPVRAYDDLVREQCPSCGGRGAVDGDRVLLAGARSTSADAESAADAQSVVRDLKLLAQYASDEDEVDILRRAVELIGHLEDELAYSGIARHRQLKTATAPQGTT